MRARQCAALFALAYLPALAADPLPALRARAQEVTVSGLSSGGYMAVQVHVAHSSIVSGAGVIAGGPYYCAQGSLATASYNCMNPGGWTPLPGVALLRAETEALAGAGRIDPTANLAAARAWLFTGTQDRTVYPAVVTALRAYYASYKTNVKLVADKPAGHAMVVEEAKNPCAVTAPPYINDCDYDAAGELLKHLGFANPPAAKAAGNVAPFDQNPFAGGDAYAISMNDTGYVYVPKACAAGGADRALPADCSAQRLVLPLLEPRLQPARLLGLVGLHRAAVPHQERRAGPRGEGHARSPQRPAMSAAIASMMRGCSPMAGSSEISTPG